MPKKAVSVTLEEDNLLWLRGRAAALKRRSLSEALDDVVTAARRGGTAPAHARSVVGSIDIAPTDPNLDTADAAVAALVSQSLARPFLVRETAPAYDGRRPRTRRRRG